MKKLIVALLLVASPFVCAKAQDPARNLTKQGIALHDEGKYEEALKLYDEAIAAAPDEFLAYYEKTLTLLVMNRFQECIDICKMLLKKFPNEPELLKVYINYGTAEDNNNNHDEALKIYTKGIKKYEHYLLYYNRGVTHRFIKGHEKEAIADFKKSVSLNPRHGSSHQLLAYMVADDNKIAGVLALGGFLLVEPTGDRAVRNFEVMNKLLGGNVKKSGDNNLTFYLSADALKDNNKDDDFSLTELTISMMSALDSDSLFMNMDPAQKLLRKMKILAEHNVSGKKNGFFTNFYVPLLAKLNKNENLETACYVMCASTGDDRVTAWLTDHKSKVDELMDWLKTYSWSNN